MKIKKIKFKGHPILGDLELNFSKPQGGVYNAVVFVGENGTGKTSLIKQICTLANGSNDNYIESVTAILDRAEASLIGDNNLNSVEITLYKINDTNNNRAYNVRYGGTQYTYLSGVSVSNHDNPVQRIFNKTVFKTGYNDNQPILDKVNNISNYDTDEEVDLSKSASVLDMNGSISVAQLLVDLFQKDSADFTTHYREFGEPDDGLVEKRVGRFREAFNNFFDNDLKFEKIENNHDVVFSKGGNKFDITSLSAGETIIVQRGGTLLKDINSDDHSIILVDEPEQSLHPKWQEKIFSFYRDILVLNEDSSTSQLFATTHSEHVLKEAILDNDATLVFVLQRGEDGEISAKTINSGGLVLPFISYDEIKYRVFGLLSNDYHDDLLGFIQEKEANNCGQQDINFINDGCPQKHWDGRDKNGVLRPNLDTESLPMYIRHYYHHPELRRYDSELSVGYNELLQSVEYLEDYIMRKGLV